MKYNIADSVIQILSETDVDGETMEYIINQLGMRDQMIKQLVIAPMEMMGARIAADAIRGDGGYEFNDEGPEFDSAGHNFDDNFYFTKQDLIEYTREIQSRALTAAKMAIDAAGVDMESYVELDLYNQQISIEVDCAGINNEIKSNVEDVFETDDESVWDEVVHVITSASIFPPPSHTQR